MAFGALVYKEKMTIQKFVGALAMLIGVALLSYGGLLDTDAAAAQPCAHPTINGSRYSNGSLDVGTNFSVSAATNAGDAANASCISVVASNATTVFIPLQSKVLQLSVAVVAIFLFWGWVTIICTFVPKTIDDQEMNFLIVSGSVFACAVSGSLLVGGLYSNAWKPPATFDAGSFWIQVSAQILSALLGNLAYFELSRQGTEGGSLIPLSNLFPVVGVSVDLARGNTISAISGVGIAIVLVAGLGLSQEMLSARETKSTRVDDANATVRYLESLAEPGATIVAGVALDARKQVVALPPTSPTLTVLY